MEDGDKDRARCRVRDAIQAGILIRPTRCDRGGRPEEQSTGSGRHPQGVAFAACRRVWRTTSRRLRRNLLGSNPADPRGRARKAAGAMIAWLRKKGARGLWGRDDADPLAHRGLPDMRLVGRGARAPAAAVLPLLPASAEVTLEVLACGGRRRWHRGRRTGAMSSHASRVRGASRTWEERGRECDRPRPRPLGLLSRDVRGIACLGHQSPLRSPCYGLA